jgi:hypothetical protein
MVDEFFYYVYIYNNLRLTSVKDTFPNKYKNSESSGLRLSGKQSIRI